MIGKQKILEFAKENDLSPSTIEKDYVLSWLLAGITTSDALKNQWIFKGGTCLKKCYFEQYRFSEDLDFTITDPTHKDVDFLISTFSQMAENIYEHSGIEILQDKLSFEIYENPRGKISIQGKVAYSGPLKRQGSSPTIKLDLSWDELLVEKPVLRNIYHPYSDEEFPETNILTYSLEEIFAEKLRALVERMRPRDLYDVIHLHQDKRWQPNKTKLLDVLKKKCEFKDVVVPTLSIINSLPGKADLITDWKAMLGNQIANLEDYSRYWDKLTGVFSWLYSTEKIGK